MLEDDGSFKALPNDLLALASRLDDFGGDGSTPGFGSTRIAQVEVIARIKPGGGRSTWVEDGRDIVMNEVGAGKGNGKQSKFRCDIAFPSNATNLDWTGALAERIVQEWLLKGFNVTVIGIGAKGSGKSYSLFGNLDAGILSSDSEHALLWNTLACLFQHRFVKRKESTLSLSLSIWEVSSNEKYRDLLSNQKVSETKECRTFVEIESVEEGVAIFRKAQHFVDSKCASHLFIQILVSDIESKLSGVLNVVEFSSSRPSLKKTMAAKIDKKENSEVALQMLAFESLLTELSLSDLAPQFGNSKISSFNSQLIGRLAPLIAKNHKTIFLTCLTDLDQSVKDNRTALQLASLARSVNTACTSGTDLEIILPSVVIVPFASYFPYAVSNDHEVKHGQTRMRKVLLAQNRAENQGNLHLLKPLRDQIQKLEQACSYAKVAFQKEKDRCLNERVQLEQICEKLESGSACSSLFVQYDRDRSNARHHFETNKDTLCAVEDKLLLTNIDYTNLARDRVKMVRREIEELLSDLKPLRKRIPQFKARSRFTQRIESVVQAELSNKKVANSRIETNLRATEKLEYSVEKMRLRENNLQSLHERLRTDRHDASKECLLMRKFLSKTESESERGSILRQLESIHAQQLYPDGNGVNKTILSLLERLETQITQATPSLLSHSTNVRKMVERMGNQLEHSKHRQKQLLHGLERLVEGPEVDKELDGFG